MSNLPARQQQQYAPATLDALQKATSDYAYWHSCQDFVRAQREGRVQYVVHIHAPQHHIHEHVHYDGGKLPKDRGGDW